MVLVGNRWQDTRVSLFQHQNIGFDDTFDDFWCLFVCGVFIIYRHKTKGRSMTDFFFMWNWCQYKLMWFGSDNSYCQGRIDVQLDVRQIQNVPAQRDQVFELQASQSHKQDTKLHTDQTSLYPHPTQSRKNSIICCFSDVATCEGLIFGVCLFGGFTTS